MKIEDAWSGIAREPDADFLAVDGETAAAIRDIDWSTSPLGRPAGWPAALKTVLRIVLASRQPMCFWWGDDLIGFHNDAFAPMLGLRREHALGRSFPEVWPDVWDEVLPYVRQALSGRATWAEDLPLTMNRNGYAEDTWWTFSYSPLHDDDGRIAGVLNIVSETTRSVTIRAAVSEANAALAESVVRAQAHIEAQAEAGRQLRLMQRELTHRMKNTLSVAQAIVSQTIRNADDLKAADRVIAGRLSALSRAQDILSEANWAGAGIADVVANALVPHSDGRDRFDVDGPRISVSGQQALGLTLAIHELATNAAKYGALAGEAGRVAIGWSVDDDQAFRFSWREHGGPRVEAPTRRGFGTRLIETVVPAYFSGTASIDYGPTGVGYVLDGSLDADASSDF